MKTAYISLLAIVALNPVVAYSADEPVLKTLGEWTCRAKNYYNTDVDLAGSARGETSELTPSQVRIVVQQEMLATSVLPDYVRPVDDIFGAVLHVFVTGGVASKLFDTYKPEGMRGRGEITYGEPLAPWVRKLASIKALKIVYDKGFVGSDYLLMDLHKDQENWMFSVVRQSLTTPREAKETSILAGRDFKPGTSVHFLTGECLKTK